MGRIKYLDGHRGVAILLVILYHVFSRWADILPYGDTYSNTIFEQGFLGVQLFFLISGFVILMTLDKTPSFQSFLYRRWLRLFPAMFICSMLILLSSVFFSARPNGTVEVLNLLPGLLFIEPYWLEKLLGIPFESIEGAFWSLYVEFKFYVIAAFLYFFVKDKKLAFTLFGLFLLWVLSKLLVEQFDNKILYMVYALTTHLSFSYFGWFASGSCFYLFFKFEQKQWLVYGALMAILSSIFLYFGDLTTLFSALAISLFFSASFVTPSIQRFLESRILIFIGFVSYPLYLLHENMIISMSIELPSLLEGMPLIISPLIAITIVTFISLLITQYLEVPVKNIIRKACDNFHDNYLRKNPTKE
jgi:peptidoglycan/LPS O-acetylase OafA/YrhL